MPILHRDPFQTHYDLAGTEGPRVLLIQGVGVAGRGWKPQQDFLATRCQTVSFDNRGIGQSPLPPERKGFTGAELAADALHLVDHLGWERFHVVGHSMGGMLAQEVAARAPERVQSLALMSTFAEGSKIGKLHSLRDYWWAIRAAIGTRRMRRRAFVRNVYPEDWLRDKDLDEVHDELADLFGRDLGSTPPVVFKQVRCCKGMTPYKEIAPRRIPTLVLHGEQDILAHISGGHKLQEVYPHASAVFFPEAGHALPLQLAERCNALLLEHVLQHDGEAHEDEPVDPWRE